MMANEYSVELTAPDGRTVISRSPVDTNNLMYGQGYRLKEAKVATPPASNQKAAPKKAGEESA